MNNKSENKILVKGGFPLRGKVVLQSSPTLSCFLTTLMLICRTKVELRGDFLDNLVSDYIHLLNNSGFNIKNNVDSLQILEPFNINDCSYSGNLDLSHKFLYILSLAEKGYVEIKSNEELIDFFKYLGFVIEEKNKVSKVYNKLATDRESITFYKMNEEYFLLAILAFMLNKKQFSISMSDSTYEIILLLEELKQYGVVKEISYGNFINIQFDMSELDHKFTKEITVPKDSNEFVFFALCAIATNGEVEIQGINPKHLASSLKIFSEVGAGYDSLSTESMKIWGSHSSDLKSLNISETGGYLNLTKLGILPILSVSQKLDGVSKISLEVETYKSLIRDINRLGCTINVEDSYVSCTSQGKVKDGKIYMEEHKEIDNYVRLLASLLSTEQIEIYDFSYLSYINNNIFKKLLDLGAKIEYIEEV
ncbi:hypothetical protein COV24_05025 [candidate division WWE3 bacterium CG10_big_fil_rev_8_21_14_0_10_32_10]|uniref:Enolpyruvate transferase domain-containing protein n=1 Tax=candidate division WWE3 bacterium CG10_big_fil_rev_8_21_14_0_10_32_10 TaxID=1975090 RepID=A0A2H0R8Z4_UNCKA|nr:MAG: hypothetical protein COV24_05025 [candidate division WWE3 bacterium CG10_big_fil_rev_8_21_14_0_10_32_10]